MQLHEWRQRYDSSEVTPGTIHTGAINWQKCFCSDLKRAYTTAQAAYTGEITQTPLLREIEVQPFRTGQLSLPIWVWRWMVRMAWLASHESQRTARDDFRQRVQAIANMLDAEPGDTLVVSHAGMMMYLRKELMRRGFRGPKFGVAEHARLYVYEREAHPAGNDGRFAIG
jgi:broad specificity phosphatase PhoE